MTYIYEDLFDIEKRPGAGVGLWTEAVERQLARVREVNYRHRLHSSPNKAEQRDDPDAISQLQADVYFLALAIRRVLRFREVFAARVNEPRLTEARKTFEAAAPNAKRLRDFYEHLDEYLLDSDRKRMRIEGRAAPVLHSRWDSDNVSVSFGRFEVDVTLAAKAAIELGRTSAAIWDEHLDQARSTLPDRSPPPTDDGVPRMFEVTIGRSAVIGGADEGHQVITGVLLDVGVREATANEIAAMAEEPDDPRADPGSNS